MTETADVIIVGAGVQGASLAFHLARRGASVLVLERESVAAGATGRSSGFVRMHYDLASDARLAWTSFPYFRSWQDLVGTGDCGFVQTGFLQVMPPALADSVRANVAIQQAIGIDTQIVERSEIDRLIHGAVTDDIGVAAYEPQSGYADPAGTAAGFLDAARARGARYVHGCRVDAVAVDGDVVVGVADRPRPIRGSRSSSTWPGPGRQVSPGPSAWRSRSRRGGTTPHSSVCRRAAAPTSRSSSTS